MSKLGTILLVVTLLGMATIGIVYKYVVQPQEATFAEYQYVWASDRFPLTVGGVKDEAVAQALATWNREAGCEIFEYSLLVPEPDVLVVDVGESPGEARADGTRDAERAFLHVKPGVPTRGRIEVVNIIDPTERYCAIGHGLGHILDLAHDRFGLMDSRVLERCQELPTPRVSDKDADAIGAQYCGAR